MPDDGRIGLAPCGHLGRHVVGNYVQCPTCDREAVPVAVEVEITEPIFRCPRCTSSLVEPFTIASATWHCWNCGAVW